MHLRGPSTNEITAPADAAARKRESYLCFIIIIIIIIIVDYNNRRRLHSSPSFYCFSAVR